MKEGWTYKKLPEISENLDSLRKPVTKKNRTAGIYPYYGASGIVDYVDDFLFDEELLCISEDGANLLMRTYPIAFPITGKVWVNNHAHVLRFKNMITQRYVEYFFAGIRLDNFITGAAQPKLTQKALNNIIIKIPESVGEQQSIVDYLDSAFAKIDAMKANAEKALNEDKALFQASLKEMLEPKEGWEENTLGDLVVSNVVGLTRGKIEQGYDKKYPYFKMNNISPDNNLCWDDLIYVDANEEELEKYSLQEGDFLFNTRNSKEWVGKSTVYRDYSTPVMLYNNNVMRIRFNDTIDPVFIAYSFLADFTKAQLEKIKSGTTNVWAIYYRDLSKILLTYPSLIEQQSIVTALDALKSKVDRLQENYDKISQECDALKQAILRQVFE